MADVKKLTEEQRATLKLAVRTLEASLRRGLTKAQYLGRLDYAAVIEKDIAKCSGLTLAIDQM